MGALEAWSPLTARRRRRAFRDALSRSCSNFSPLHSSPIAPPCAAAFAASRPLRLFTPPVHAPQGNYDPKSSHEKGELKILYYIFSSPS
eukprot:5579630-Prymnesium_polylepis.1